MHDCDHCITLEFVKHDCVEIITLHPTKPQHTLRMYLGEEDDF